MFIPQDWVRQLEPCERLPGLGGPPSLQGAEAGLHWRGRGGQVGGDKGKLGNN